MHLGHFCSGSSVSWAVLACFGEELVKLSHMPAVLPHVKGVDWQVRDGSQNSLLTYWGAD